MSGVVYPLQGNQLAAVDPQESVWLSASAGTGKTQVLSARVLRLLLQPRTDPSQILCLTFTKAGAAEMAVRINEVLARWVRLEDTQLAHELGYLGAKTDPETREHARTLFASVLDCPGGGLRIDTIHAFSQWLLANFPNEAELIPGAQPMEDRERELLSREVLSNMLVEAEEQGDDAMLQAVADFTRRKDPDALRSWLMRCAGAKRLWLGRNAWQPPLRGHVLRLLGLPSDASEAHLAEFCAAPAFDDEALRTCLEGYRAWKSKSADVAVPAIEKWLATPAKARPAILDELQDVLFYKNGNPRLPKSADDVFRAASVRVFASIAVVADYQHLLDLSEFLTPALELGRKFALAWDAAKLREGLLDFDDLIERAAMLLSEQVSADWIRYKLDRRFDHILIDEAQDTNEAQWSIIDALIDDFFAGEGAAGNTLRTIFTVGDYKQAIFGFQGTSPENFSAARERVRKAMRDAAENAIEMRHRGKARDLLDLDLGQSFRTSEPVLEFVDRAIEAIGPEAFGLDDGVSPHSGQERAGLVTLWNSVHDTSDEAVNESGDEDWLARHDRQLAERIATQVQRWLTTEPFALEKGEHRNAKAGDIMVLVRSRKELASLIVARLHAKGVPVAGVDRLRLGAPLVVKDLMAAIRFAAQPLDDLNLANLLSSPLIGWSQDDLLKHVPRGEGVRLWHHLRKSDEGYISQTVERLRQLLALADFETPQALLEWMLVGPWKGREKLIARLGRESGDPIDELLNAAFAYEAIHTPSLAGFIQWFDASDDDLKRDPDQAANFVRVMTVHGAKGLQAPIVIMADAVSKPGRVRDLSLEDELSGRDVPLPTLNADERRGPIERAYDVAEAAELQEHWRLLYVAMTRAEEALFIGGSLGKRDKAPHENSWFARLEPLFADDAVEDDLWSARREIGRRAKPVGKAATNAKEAKSVELPAWALSPVGPEPRPPRPLAPSSAGDDASPDPPMPPDVTKDAARRGVLIHALLERLPDAVPGDREHAAMTWLDRQAVDLAPHVRQDMLNTALTVIDDPAFAAIFSPAALAEVPLAATVEGQVVAGIADRLLVMPEKVTVVDFKSARRPPTALEEIPAATIRQMAAYVSALAVIYPEREIEAALLYTQTPQLFAIPNELLEANKPRLSTNQESFAASPVE